MAQASFAADLVCPERALFEGHAQAVTCRTSDGFITVMALHAPMVADVLPGVVSVDGDQGRTDFLVHGGFLHVETATGINAEEQAALATKVTLLAGVAEPVAEIDAARAEIAKAAAEAELTQLGNDDDPTTVARRAAVEGDLARAELRLATAKA